MDALAFKNAWLYSSLLHRLRGVCQQDAGVPLIKFLNFAFYRKFSIYSLQSFSYDD